MSESANQRSFLKKSISQLIVLLFAVISDAGGMGQEAEGTPQIVWIFKDYHLDNGAVLWYI